MSLVIITKRCFLVCERVTSIIIEESNNFEKEKIQESSRRFNFLKKKIKETKLDEWVICVNYIPESVNASSGKIYPSGSKEEKTLELLITGKREAFALFNEMVHEIREQNPDLLYLDKLIEKMLSEGSNGINR